MAEKIEEKDKPLTNGQKWGYVIGITLAIYGILYLVNKNK